MRRTTKLMNMQLGRYMNCAFSPMERAEVSKYLSIPLVLLMLRSDDTKDQRCTEDDRLRTSPP